MCGRLWTPRKRRKCEKRRFLGNAGQGGSSSCEKRNSLDVCDGLISRIRKTKKGIEKAVLDFFIICDKILPFLKRMVIDEQRLHVLTNFNPIRQGGRPIESDHNTEILELDLKFDKKKPERREVFNFKN